MEFFKFPIENQFFDPHLDPNQKCMLIAYPRNAYMAFAGSVQKMSILKFLKIFLHSKNYELNRDNPYSRVFELVFEGAKL